MERLTQEEFDLILDVWKDDHVLAIESLFGIELTEQQKQLVILSDNQSARVAVASCTGSGKSAVCSMLVFIYLMLLPDCRILVTSPSFNQLVRVFSSELDKWWRKMPQQFQELFKLTREKVEYLGSTKYNNFCNLVTASVENKESLQGGHADNYVIIADEASGIKEDAFDILLGTLSTGEGGRFIQVSNPVRSSGRFYQIFQNEGNAWNKLYFSAYDSPNVNDQWIEEMKDTYGADSDLFRMRVLGKFPRVGIAQYISAEIVEEAINNHLPLNSYNNFGKVMGVDVARFGDDSTVLVVRQGPKLLDIKTYKGLNTMEVAARVAEFQAVHKCSQIHVDAIGIGAGTYDRCKELGLPVVEVNVSNKSTEPNIYCNLRSQIWGQMKEWIANGADLPKESREKDTNLAAELTSMEYFYNTKMQLQLMSKKDLKRMGHPSPDIADALALTFASAVYQIKTRSRQKLQVRKVNFMWV
jgi:hypothetical protein